MTDFTERAWTKDHPQNGTPPDPSGNNALIQLAAECRADPLRWASIVHPWDDLPEHKVRTWQADIMGVVGRHLQDPKTRFTPLKIAVRSGHGVGKSSLIGMLAEWGLATCPDTRIVITANTENQLRTKTWPEVSLWQRRSLARDWFSVQATSITTTDPDPVRRQHYRMDMVPWSSENTEAFAGLHNRGRRIILIFDEASAIDDKVWDVAEGALTDENTEIIWLAFGNPTRNSGRFHDCFGSRSKRWVTRQIDSRTVEGTNKAEIAKWIEDYGEDSDFVRVRVLGRSPRAGIIQFMSSELISAAGKRPKNEAMALPSDPVVAGLDVARFGEDESVLVFRCGLDARSYPGIIWNGLDSMQLAGAVAAEIALAKQRWGFTLAMLFVDETGVGGGVLDRLRQLGVPAIGVNNGGKTDWPVTDGENVSGAGELVNNKGAEMWARMRLWMKRGMIPADEALMAQLESRQYFFDAYNKQCLEKKVDMKKRGLKSPDRADALSLTFAYPVQLRDSHGNSTGPTAIASEYDPLAQMRAVRSGKGANHAYNPIAIR